MDAKGSLKPDTTVPLSGASVNLKGREGRLIIRVPQTRDAVQMRGEAPVRKSRYVNTRYRYRPSVKVGYNVYRRTQEQLMRRLLKRLGLSMIWPNSLSNQLQCRNSIPPSMATPPNPWGLSRPIQRARG